MCIGSVGGGRRGRGEKGIKGVWSMTHLGGNYIARSPLQKLCLKLLNNDLINNKNITDGEQYVSNVLDFLCFFFFKGSWKDDQAGETNEERPKRHRCFGVPGQTLCQFSFPGLLTRR